MFKQHVNMCTGNETRGNRLNSVSCLFKPKFVIVDEIWIASSNEVIDDVSVVRTPDATKRD